MSVKLVKTSNETKFIELGAVVFRACRKCKCPNPEPVSKFGTKPPPWTICPRCGTSAIVEDKGLIAFYYKNPIKMLYRTLKKRITGK